MQVFFTVFFRERKWKGRKWRRCEQLGCLTKFSCCQDKIISHPRKERRYDRSTYRCRRRTQNRPTIKSLQSNVKMNNIEWWKDWTLLSLLMKLSFDCSKVNPHANDLFLLWVWSVFKLGDFIWSFGFHFSSDLDIRKQRRMFAELLFPQEGQGCVQHRQEIKCECTLSFQNKISLFLGSKFLSNIACGISAHGDVVEWL